MMNARPAIPHIAEHEANLLGSGSRKHWLLRDDCVFLNHGSFGATPRSVLAAQDHWRIQMEQQPVEFLVRVIEEDLRRCANNFAPFIGAKGDNIAFVSNATEGVNAVLRSLTWNPNDEILCTSHNYGAVVKAAEYVCKRFSTVLRTADVPFPIKEAQQVIDAIEVSISPRTRLLIIDHVTSSTALVFPIQQIISVCHNRGVQVLVDGAHAPGMLDLDLDTIGADYYAGNCHKWLFAPKGCGFLWVSNEQLTKIHPTTISWGWPDGFAQEFDWTGTRDPSPWLSLSAALEFYNLLPTGRRQEYNNQLTAWAAAFLADAWQVPEPCPAVMRASMATLPLPGELPGTKDQGRKLHDILMVKHNVEVPVVDFANRLWIRVSAQAYNTADDYKRLAQVVRQESTN